MSTGQAYVAAPCTAQSQGRKGSTAGENAPGPGWAGAAATWRPSAITATERAPASLNAALALAARPGRPGVVQENDPGAWQSLRPEPLRVQVADLLVVARSQGQACPGQGQVRSGE